MNIDELSEIVCLNKRKVRYYFASGLVSGVTSGQGSPVKYNDVSVRDILTVLRLSELGVSIRNMKIITDFTRKKGVVPLLCQMKDEDPRVFKVSKYEGGTINLDGTCEMALIIASWKIKNLDKVYKAYEDGKKKGWQDFRRYVKRVKSFKFSE